MTRERLYLYDTTLRDGQQTQGVQFSTAEKITIATALDTLGVDYIEGGWPGANPTDSAFFDAAPITRAKMTAFGMTKRNGMSAQNDDVLAAVMNAGTRTVCLVGKTHDFHVSAALGITLDENTDNIAKSIAHLVAQGREALFGDPTVDACPHGPVRAEHVGGRIGGQPERHPDPPGRVDHVRIGDAQLPQERPGGSRVIVGNNAEDDDVGSERRGRLLQQRHLGATRCTPGGPDVDHHRSTTLADEDPLEPGQRDLGDRAGDRQLDRFAGRHERRQTGLAECGEADVGHHHGQ